ncbi:hypothetical protein C1I93_03710 [Micromonospora endophytica]|uniref:Uncharacterized protein n=1 Tax=Micromonospora endophytica TaxID=515350 RepID=A0A2W2DJX7_9ACTN|nr:hypothetical protein C1I93_03710 [Micromonospora endophytica]RIW47076.1 hypothetical protein D3H59_10825 [Micromonospora endophytica]
MLHLVSGLLRRLTEFLVARAGGGSRCRRGGGGGGGGVGGGRGGGGRRGAGLGRSVLSAAGGESHQGTGQNERSEANSIHGGHFSRWPVPGPAPVPAGGGGPPW